VDSRHIIAGRVLGATKVEPTGGVQMIRDRLWLMDLVSSATKPYALANHVLTWQRQLSCSRVDFLATRSSFLFLFCTGVGGSTGGGGG
jgi:hypothetical protein